MKVIILAAGYAVRLQPLTLNTPKSLLAVNNRKIIDRILDKVDAVRGPADGISIITNARFYGDFRKWLDASGFKGRASLINDGSTSNETRLGAIRDLEIAIAAGSMDDDLFVVAGDNLFDMDINGFLSFARSHADGVSVALYDIGDLKIASNFGVLKLDGDNRVVDFEEKPERPKSTLVSTGIYYFPRGKVRLIDEYVKLKNKLDAPGYYISWLCKVDKVYGFKFSEDWYDIGSIESYNKANQEYREKEKG